MLMGNSADFDQAVEQMVATAAEFGYTREQVMGWRRPDLLRFLDQLNARAEIEQAGLNVVTDLYAAASVWSVCDRCMDDLAGDEQKSPLCPDCCLMFNSGNYVCNHRRHAL
ncbi:hypothetical protein ACN27G_27650 [Plantactinospora sp. WMMB334]|uniref:hypothetical protein n=1 Tax=Plantactinospora sp. WMMB334 TaxID=3404119 RepID=UPI003B9530A8